MSTTSHFKKLINATITFNVPIGTSGTNTVGNLALTTQPLIVQAFLRVGYAPAYQRPEGVPEIAIVLKGYAVEPMSLPPELAPLSPASIVMQPHKGTFTLDANIINAPYGRAGLGAKLEKYLGTAFAGWFVITGKV